jgi:hypothetical protein
MRNRIINTTFVICILTGIAFVLGALATDQVAPQEKGSDLVTTYFCPSSGDAVSAEQIRLAEAETKGIHLEAYTLTDAPLVQALCDAQKRGTPVTVVLDGVYGVQSSKKALEQLKQAGVTVRIDAAETDHGGIAHTKVIVFLGQNVGRSGSANFTLQSRKRNHEVVHFFYGGLTPAQLEIDFQNHLAHSKPQTLTIELPFIPTAQQIARAKRQPNLLPLENGKPDGYLYLQLGDWEVEFDYKGEHYSLWIPDGFISDGTSIPRWVESLANITPDGLERRASWLHDYLYKHNGRCEHLMKSKDGVQTAVAEPFTKDAADEIFWWMLVDDGCTQRRAAEMFQAVHFFGQSSWDSHK